jgi:hypothetical protein
MNYMLVFNEPSAVLAERDDPAKAPAYWGAWKAYIDALAASGAMQSGNGLQPPATATIVRVKEGRRIVQDGPYADAKEFLGGYVVIDAKHLDEAIEWAARSPAARSGSVEVRPVLPPMLPA